MGGKKAAISWLMGHTLSNRPYEFQVWSMLYWENTVISSGQGKR